MTGNIAITGGDANVIHKFERAKFVWIDDRVMQINDSITIENVGTMESYDHFAYTGFMALPPTKKSFITYRKVDIHI